MREVPWVLPDLLGKGCGVLEARLSVDSIRLVLQAHAQGTILAAADAYPIETLYRVLKERFAALEPDCAVSTEEWLRALPDRQAQAALLLALHELAQLGRVLLDQWETLGPMLLKCIGRGCTRRYPSIRDG